MRQRLKLILATIMMVALFATNIYVASAHQWGKYHWHKSGSSIVIQNWIYGSTQTQAESARQDGWNKIAILFNYRSAAHTDISVFDGNFGNTGWWGLATLESLDFDWGSFWWNHITHAHARYNAFYGGTSADIQGIYCQEIAHGWGLDHSNTGDCMGKTYFHSINVYGPHNNIDFNAMYRSH